MDASGNWIAERKLVLSNRESKDRAQVFVRVYAPFPVVPGSVSFSVADGVAGCKYEIVGLPLPISDTCYGADALQALQLAVDVEPMLRRLAKTYDIYFESGEPYFDED